MKKWQPILGVLLIIPFMLTGCAEADVTDKAVESPSAVNPANPLAGQTARHPYFEAQSHLLTSAEWHEKQLPRLPDSATPQLKKLEKELRDLIAEAKSYSPLKDWTADQEYAPQDKEDIKAVTTTAIQEMQTELAEYLASVEAERISAVPKAENAAERMTRIQEETGLTINYDVGDCSIVDGKEIASGCFTPGESKIRITPYWFTEASECELRKTLAHEYRHYEQDQEGMFDTKDIEELEEDARANEYRGGC